MQEEPHPSVKVSNISNIKDKEHLKAASLVEIKACISDYQQYVLVIISNNNEESILIISLRFTKYLTLSSHKMGKNIPIFPEIHVQ